VVFGYLFTISAVKLGGFEIPDLLGASWILRTEWHYGYLLMAVPALWTAWAMYLQHKGDDDMADAYSASGIGIAVLLAMLFVYCVLEGVWGPPRPLYLKLQ